VRARGRPHRALAGAICALLWASVWASSASAALEFPKLTGRVVDEAGLLSGADEARIARLLEGHENATGNQVVVVTLASLQGRTIEEIGYQLGRHWGIGQAGEDNGALLIVAPNERKVRIEVGYGLEGELTDAISSNIVNAVILPAFKRGDLSGGIAEGASAMIEALGGEYVMRERRRTGTTRSPVNGLPFALMLLGAFVFLNFNRGARHGYRRGAFVGPMLGGGRSGFGGGGFGGGFSGGGGGFGGGGASGGW
jgi:uncharacterized protein